MSQNGHVQLTMLNSMASRDFAASLDRHVQWGIRVLDLKDGIFGKGLLGLSDDEVRRAAKMIGQRDLRVHCLSTGLFCDELEKGEAAFRTAHLSKVSRAIELARAFEPRFIRLLSARTSRRGEIADSAAYIRKEHPWLIDLYAQAVEAIDQAGFEPTIENEVGGCIFAKPEEILGFFELLDAGDRVSLTWDVQNLWEQGTFPSMAIYRQLKPLIRYLHLKGGMHDGNGTALCWGSSLEDASWPVMEITRAAVADGVSPVLCLNPPHGRPKEGYDGSNRLERDLAFLRREIPEIA